MKTIFVNTGLDDYLSEKIEKGQVYSNVQERLPRKKIEVTTLYKALEQGKSFLNGFTIPRPQEEELRKALTVITRVIEGVEKKRQEPIITEQELLEALDYLDEIAREQRG